MKSAFARYIMVLAFIFGVVFTQVSATINVNSTPATNNDFCSAGAPTLTLPIVATSNCGSGSVVYQWYVSLTGASNISSATAITSAGAPAYSGWNTSTLGVNNAVALGTNTSFFAIITESSGACSDIDTVGPFYYTKVSSVPTVLLSPLAPVVCEGASVNYTASVTAPSPAGVLTYIWEKTPDGGSPSVVKTTTDVLTTSDSYGYTTALTDDQDDIQVSVSNACGSASSAVATVTVNPKPVVTIPASNSSLSACQGNNVNITYNISNALRDPSSGGGAVNWSIAFSGDAALIALLTSSGSGNTNVNLNVGAALAPGAYSATISTITNTSDGCARTISTNAINVTIFPVPTVTFSVSPTDICNGSGSGTSFKVKVENAEYTVGTSTVAVNWSFSRTESSFTNVTGCTGGSAGILPATVTGSGNGEFTYNIPTTMPVGIYQYTLTTITNTSNGCSPAAATGTTVVSWRVDPTPNITVTPSTASACEGNTASNFSINVTNTAYCGTVAGVGTPGNVSWELAYGSGAGTINSGNSNLPASPLTAGGSFSTNAGLAVGTYVFSPSNITVTTPASPGCTRDVSAKKFTLTVNPEPIVTFNTASITQCEGTVGTTFSIDVTNAVLNSVGQNWSVAYTQNGSSALSGTPCAAGTSAGILPGSITGTGNGSKTYTIPSGLAPGYYTYTLTSITNTSAGCSAGAGSLGANPTITIIIEPKPQISMNPDTKDVCENDAESFNLNITNTVGCSGIGTTSSAGWNITVHTDAVQSDINTQIPLLTGTGDQAYTINVNTLGTLSPDDHMLDASVASSAGTCVGSSSRDTFVLSVDPRPDIQIDGAAGDQTINICEGDGGSFSFTVANALHNSLPVNWEITYSESSGQVASGCTGAVTVDLPGSSGTYVGSGNGANTITIPATLPIGQYIYTVTNIVNTDGPCTGTVDGVTGGPQKITINVYPKPTFTISPRRDSVCENNALTNAFSVNVTNAKYCSDPSTIADAGWQILGANITDNVASNVTAPITGTGNGSQQFNANTTLALTPADYDFTATAIETTGLPVTCSRTVTSNNIFTLTVDPAPDASFTTSTVSVCEGNTATVTINVSNAVLNGSGVNWSYEITEASGNLNSSCNVSAAQNASLVRDSSGNGNNATVVYNIPNNLAPGVYTYTISNVLNTDKNCTGTSATSVVSVYVYPKLQMALTPTSDEICEGETSAFDIEVTNARYCTALNTASTNVPWTLVYSDATQSDIFPDPLTGSGNSSYTFTANDGGLLPAGQYQFITSTITGQIVTPTVANCSVSVPDTFTLTINPEPIASFSTPSITLCQGATSSFNVAVTNAQYTTGSTTVEANWIIDLIGDSTDVTVACASGGAGAGLFSVAGANNISGTGDSMIVVNIPGTLLPGVYTYTINSVQNISNTCTGAPGANPTITITVYPKPDVDVSVDTVWVCENTTGTVDITVTNAEYCASIGGSLINVTWGITHGDTTQSDIPTSVWYGNGNMSATTYTMNISTALPAGTYNFDISQIENITQSCINTDSFAGVEVVLVVNDLPMLTINSIETPVCDGSTSTINYTVSDVASTDGWSFTFTTDGGTTNHTVTGVGPVTMVDTTTVALTPPGVKTIAFSAITNTTTGCIGNTPSTSNITILTLPDVTAFVDAAGTNICSGLDNDYNVTVANSAGKDWIIWYNIDGVPGTWTGTGNGVHTLTIPVQYHQDSVGAFDNRPITIDSIAWTAGAGTPPLCKNTNVTDNSADLNVMPRPWVTLVAPEHSCINLAADVTYFLGGVRSTDNWDFDWYTTNPTDGPNNITGTDTLTSMFTTLPLNPVGLSAVNVFAVTNTTTGCDSMPTPPFTDTIVVDPPSDAGTLSPSYTICDGDMGPYVFTLSGYVGDVQNWDSSDNDGFTWYNIGNMTNTHTVVYPHLTTRYHVIVKSGACPADTSNEVILFVHPQPAATFVSVDDSICVGSDVNTVINVSGVPNTHNWTINYTYGGAASGSGTWTGTGSSATINRTLATSSFAAGDYFIAIDKITNTNTGCDTTVKDTVRFKIKSAPVGSTASTSNDTLCTNSDGFVRWDGTATDGYVVKWQKKTPSAGSWTDISGSASDSIEFYGLTTTTMFRAVIENAPCSGQAFSTPVTITIMGANPDVAIVGSATQKFCASATNTATVQFAITGTSGFPWTLTILEGGDSTHTVTGTGNQTINFVTTPGEMIESFNVVATKLVISAGSYTCTKNLANVAIANITVIDMPSATLNSITSTVCDGGSISMTVTVSDIKSVESWKLTYTINGSTKTNTGTGSGTFTWVIPYTVSGGNSTQTVALVSIENTTTKNSANATCTNTLSGSANYTVRQATAPGTIGTTASVCKGASGSISQTVASTNGSVITGWLMSTDGGATWTSTGNTTSTQNYVNIQTTTRYRAVYSNSPCDTASSNTVVISVVELPTAMVSLSGSNDTICEGNTSTVNLTVGNVANGQTFSLTFIEGSKTRTLTFTNNASNTHTFTTGVINSTTDITLMNISTTSGTTCSNSSLNSTVTITVQEKPTATIASYDNRLCHGEKVDFTLTIGNVGSTDNWTVTAMLDANTETFSGTGTGTFSFTTTATVTSTSDILKLVSVVNNSTQDACSRTLTQQVTIAVDPTTVAGVIGTAAISADTIVCKGGSGYVKEYTAGTGNITKWQSRRNGTSTWVDINSTNSTQFFFNLTDTTEYRAVYQSGLCSQEFSNIVTATPKALPVVVLTNIIDDSICAGTTAQFQITVTNVDAGSTFRVTYSEGSVPKTSPLLTQNASGVHTLTTSALTANTLVQLTGITVINTGSASVPACSNSASSNGTVTVLDLPFASITAGPDTLCQNDQIVFTVTVTNVLATDNWKLRYELESDEDTITGTGPGSVTWVDTDPNTAESAKIQLIEILNLSNLGICKSVNTDDWDIYIYKPTEPGDIAAADDTICKGGSTTISEVTGTPKQGVTVSWEYKPLSASNWTALSNNNSTLNVINLQETTDYRAIYKSGVCDTAHSNVVRITVAELPLATISGSTTICAGNFTNLTVTVSNVGTTQDWEIEYLEGTYTKTMTGTGGGNHTLTVGGFNTSFNVVLKEIATVSGVPQCLNDKLTNNAQSHVDVNQRPYASLNSVTSPVCQGSTSSFSYTVSNVKSGDNWTLTYEVDDATGGSKTTSGTGPGTFTLATPVLTSAKTYVVKLHNITNTTTTCDSNLSSTMNIISDATTVAGSVVADSTVCYGSHVGTVRHSGGNGSIVRWESSVDGGTSWSSITNTNSNFTYTNLTNTTKYRVVKKNGVCSEAATAPITVTVRPLPVATITGSDTICAGSTANLTVSVSNTYNQSWSVSYLVGTVLDTISVSGPATTGTINTGTIKTNTDVTLKKIWMTSGTPQCENNNLTNNATATVEVDDIPNATLISLTDTVCTGSPAYGQITVNDVRSSENWRVYWSINGGAADSVSGTGSGSFNITTANLTANPSTLRLVSMINRTTGCTGTLTDQDVVVVSPTTVGGTLTGTDTVCKGTNSGTLTLGADAVGKIIRWEYSTNGGTTWTSITNTATTYSYSNLTQSTTYRVVVKSGACNTEYSSWVTIKVNELPVASIVKVGASSICQGSNTYVVLNITNVGAGMNWELTYLQGSSVKTLTGTGPGADTIFTGTLNTTTSITLQSMKITSGKPQCANSSFTNQYTTTINIISNPKATITNAPTEICKGTTPTVTILVDNVLSSEAWTVIYKVNGGSNITSTGVGSGQFNLSNMPVFNTEGNNVVRLVSITNTSSSPNCTGALADSVIIKVDSTSVGGTISGPTIVCLGSSAKMKVSGYRGAIVKWQYSTDAINYYDIANTSDSLVVSSLTTKTWYRVEVMSGVCASAFSTVKAIDVQQLPTVTINNPTQTICSGDNVTLNLSIGNVNSTSTWTVGYKVNGTAGTYTTGTGTTESITFGPFTQTTTIEFTDITVTNGLGCANTISEKAVITVTPNPMATFDSYPDSLCHGDVLIYNVEISDVATGTKWLVDYEVDGTAGPTKKGTGSGVFTINTGRTVSANSVKIKLTQIALDNALGCDTDLKDSVTIKVSPKSVGGTLSPATSTICKGASATLTLSGETGAVQNWEYSTDNGATWTVLSNKTKSVTITNINETTLYRVFVKSGTCSGAYSSVATVTVIPTPEATVTSNAKVCPGDVATFTLHVTDVPAGNGWSVVYKRNGVLVGTPVTGTGSGDFNFTVAGMAYAGNPTFITVELVSITNTTFGCVNNTLKSTATAKVTPNPVASFTAANECEDSTVMFNNTSSIAEGNVTAYTWYFGDGDSSKNASPVHVYKAAGTYNVRLVAWSDNGCRGEVTQSITVYPNPIANFTAANVCQNDVFSATDKSTVSSGNIVSWYWMFGDGTTSTAQNPTHRYSASGTYQVTLTVTTNNGCTNTITKDVTVYILPEANFVAAPVCENNAMQFVNASAIGYGTMTYDWNFAGQGTSTAKDPSFTFNGFGQFNVRLIAISNNGCRDTINRSVTIYAAPTADFSVADVCIGDASVFVNNSSVPAGDTMVEYFWNFGDSEFSGLKNPMHQYAASGSYNVTLRVKSNRGCENTVAKVANVIALPDVNLTADGTTEFCDGDSVTLRANANARTYNWSWTGGSSTNGSITAKDSGWYKVTITAPPIGCSNTDSILVVVHKAPNIQAWLGSVYGLKSDTIYKGESIDLHATGGVDYVWTPSTYLNSTLGTPVRAEKVLENITYTVNGTDIYGCKGSDQVTIFISPDWVLKVYNVITPNGDGKNDVMAIENIWAYPDAQITIFNRYGMEVYSADGKTFLSAPWDGTNKNGNPLPDGAYYYVITHPDFPDKVFKGAINIIREK
ncbi:MAG: gliding motility-associated C-terminal domain-containing protein [Flavobacteriales bacterium]|nr:gliding motility-associated C-terminal domain-containing protein [Flavobacteriales bacterium]